MTKKITYLLLSLMMVSFMFFSCEKEIYNNSGSAKLAFSTDTLMFDTIFTTLGSTTQSFRVVNPYSQPMLISTIKLAGGDRSFYRLNIDGEMVNELSDLEILGNDSIYIFVEVTVDPNGVGQPMIVQDSVVFKVNGNLQDVDLIAYGQDFVPIRQGIITTTTWTAEKPYLIFDYAFIDTLQTLTIEPGTQIFLHDSAGIIAVGNIIAKGTPEKPIIFRGDRLEALYKDVPDQWGGIMIYPNTTKSIFENVVIKNGMVGFQLGHIDYDGGANVKLHNVKIEHITYYGIYAIKSTIEATNTLVADCGNYAVLLAVGGSYDFTHCTIANYWGGYSVRTMPALAVSNQLSSGDKYYSGDLVKANFHNSIVYGNLTGSEVIFGDNGANAFNCNFDHCLVKVSDSVYNANTGLFTTFMRESDIRDIDSLFNDINNYDFMPDSLSQLRNYGLRSYSEKLPFDLGNISRLADDGPDIGAYEYIYIEKKEEKE